MCLISLSPYHFMHLWYIIWIVHRHASNCFSYLYLCTVVLFFRIKNTCGSKCFLIKSAFCVINPLAWMKSLCDEILLRMAEKRWISFLSQILHFFIHFQSLRRESLFSLLNPRKPCISRLFYFFHVLSIFTFSGNFTAFSMTFAAFSLLLQSKWV